MLPALLIILITAFNRVAGADEGRARQLFKEGETAFSCGRYADAARAFEAAYAESHLPSLLWNVAQSYRRQYDLDGDIVDLRRAAAVFRNYLELLPPKADRSEVRAALADVNRQIEAHERAGHAPTPSAPPVAPGPAPAPSTNAVPAAALAVSPAAPVERTRSHKALAIGLGVAGGALVIGGAIALGLTLGGGTVEDGLLAGSVQPGFQRIKP